MALRIAAASPLVIGTPAVLVMTISGTVRRFGFRFGAAGGLPFFVPTFSTVLARPDQVKRCRSTGSR